MTSTRPESHEAWHSRGYLPHFDEPNVIQSITLRLHDALPTHVVESLAQKLAEESDVERRAQIEAYLDAGRGACYLADPRIGRLVESALLHFDGQRYRQIAWVIMPNHVHTLIETSEGPPLRAVIHSWKSFTASEANRILDRKGRFWYPDYFDRYVRDGRHLANLIRYIHENPVKAGLAERPEDWPLSSARFLKES